MCLLSQGEHREILKLSRSPAFHNNSRWMAEQIGVSVDAINIAVSRMLQLGILRVSASGRWEDGTALSELTPQSFRRYVAERVPFPLQRRGA
jgi:hypothetical protein